MSWHRRKPRRALGLLLASAAYLSLCGVSAGADFPIPSQPGPGLLVVVVDKLGCIQSRIFYLPAGPNPRLARRVAGGYLQVIAKDGGTASPPIPVPADVVKDPDADIFKIVHEAYERHQRRSQEPRPPSQPTPQPPGQPPQPRPGGQPQQPGIEPGTDGQNWDDGTFDGPPPTPQQQRQIERDERGGKLPQDYNLPDPNTDPDFTPLPDQVVGQQPGRQPDSQPGGPQPGGPQPGGQPGGQQGGQPVGDQGPSQFVRPLTKRETQRVQRYTGLSRCWLIPPTTGGAKR